MTVAGTSTIASKPDKDSEGESEMDPDTARAMRSSGLIAAGAAIVLLIVMFALRWYGAGPITASYQPAGSVNGWHGLLHLHWLMLAAILAVLLDGSLRASRGARRRSPASDAAASLISLAMLLWLGYRVLISVPHEEKWPAYLGLCLAATMFVAIALPLLPARRGSTQAPA